MGELLLETIQSYNTYLSKIPSGVENIAELLRTDKLSEAGVEIKNFSEGISWMIELQTIFKRVGIEAELPVEEIIEFLEEINVGLDKQDFVLVADMFEYGIEEVSS